MKMYVELSCSVCGKMFDYKIDNASELPFVFCRSCLAERKQRIEEKNSKKKAVLTELETFSIEDRVKLLEEELYNLKYKDKLVDTVKLVLDDMPTMINNTRSI